MPKQIKKLHVLCLQLSLNGCNHFISVLATFLCITSGVTLSFLKATIPASASISLHPMISRTFLSVTCRSWTGEYIIRVSSCLNRNDKFEFLNFSFTDAKRISRTLPISRIIDSFPLMEKRMCRCLIAF